MLCKILRLTHLNLDIYSISCTDESLDIRINDTEKELEQIYNQKAKGAQIRLREKWVELGEQNNSYFLGLEKQRQVNKSISKSLDESNKVILSSVISKESRCDDKFCSSFSKDRLASRLNFDLLLQYIIVASLISIFRTSHKSRQSTLLFT
jgi:hypothetical protein